MNTNAHTKPWNPKEQPLPNSLEAEKRVLGAMIRFPEAAIDASTKLSPDDFYQPAHGKIFGVLCELATTHKSYDLLMIADALERRGEIESCGGQYYLIELANSVATSVHIDYHIVTIQEHSARRKIIRHAVNLQADALSQENSIAQLSSDAYNGAMSIVVPKSQGFDSIADYLDDAVEGIQRRINRVRENKPFKEILTGITDFDHRFGGFDRGEYIVVGARPSEGKSLLCFQIALNIAKTGMTVGVISLEQTAREMIQRVLYPNVGKAKFSTDSTSAKEIKEKANELMRMKDNLFFTMPQARPLTRSRPIANALN